MGFLFHFCCGAVLLLKLDCFSLGDASLCEQLYQAVICELDCMCVLHEKLFHFLPLLTMLGHLISFQAALCCFTTG